MGILVSYVEIVMWPRYSMLWRCRLVISVGYLTDWNDRAVKEPARGAGFRLVFTLFPAEEGWAS